MNARRSARPRGAAQQWLWLGLLSAWLTACTSDGSGAADHEGSPDGGTNVPSTAEVDASLGAATAVGDVGDAGDASTPTGPRLYVTVAGTNEVLAIDEASQKVVEHIPVGTGPAIILATPDGKKLYTANWTDNTVSAIDLANTRAGSRSIALPGRPYVIAMAPDGKFVYAGLSNNQIAVLSTATDSVERMMPTPDLPASIIVSADGATLYVAEIPMGTLRAVSATTGEVQRPAIPVGGTPAWITSSHDGKKVYTLNYTSDDVTVVDTTTFTVDTKVPTGAMSKGIIGNVTPDGTRLYVTNLGTGDLIAIDTQSNAIVQRIPLGARPVGIHFRHDGKRLYVTDYGVGSLDTPTSAGLAFLTMGVFTPLRDGQVSVYDVATGALVGSKITVGAGPTSVVGVR
jgi:YVTN family beta-propeller protein